MKPSSFLQKLAITGLTTAAMTGIGITVSPAQAADVLKYIKDGENILTGLQNIYQLLSTNPAAGLTPPVAIIFSESSAQMNLQIAGGLINSTSSATYSITGAYWTGTLGITQSNGFFYDETSISGNFSHFLGPDPNDGMSNVMSYNLVLNGFFPPPFNPSKTVTIKNNPTTHPNNHKDNWSGDIDGNIDILSNITAWNASIAGKHVVPEPSANLGLLALSTLGLASTIKRKQK